MKIEITKSDQPSQTYPLLARCKQDQRVVLFTSVRSGLQLIDRQGKADVLFSDGWLPSDLGDTWDILPAGTVVTITV